MSHRYRETADSKSGFPRRYYSLPRSTASGEEISEDRDARHTSRRPRVSSDSTHSPTSSTVSSGRRYGGLRSQKATDSTGSSAYGEPYSSHRSGRRTQGSVLPELTPSRNTETATDKMTTISDSTRPGSFSHTGSALSRNRSLVHADLESSVKSEIASRGQYRSGEGKDLPFRSAKKENSGSQDALLDDDQAPGIPDSSSILYNRRREARRRTSSESDASIRLPSMHPTGNVVAGDEGTLNFNRNGSTESPEKGSKEEEEDDDANLMWDDSIKRSASRDISLLSREIASAYEGSLTRRYSDKRQAKKSESPTVSPGKEPEHTVSPLVVMKSDEKSAHTLEQQEMSEQMGAPALVKGISEPTPGTVEPGQKHTHHGAQFNMAFSHRRSRSDGSHHLFRPEDLPSKKTAKRGMFSQRKLSDSEIIEAAPIKHSKWGLFSRRRSSGSSRDSSEGEEKGGSVSKRKNSGPVKLAEFTASLSDGKRNKDISKRKFSVPSKFFPTKDSDARAKSTCSSPEATKKELRRRRVTLPGKYGFSRSSSTEREIDPEQPNNAPPSDVALSERRRRTFKKAATFDCETDKAKASVLHRLKFWDKKDRSAVSGKSEVSVSTGSPERKSSNESSSSKQPLHLGRRKKSKEEKLHVEMSKQEVSGRIGQLELEKGSEQIQEHELKNSGHRQQKDMSDQDNSEPKARYVGSVESVDSPPLRSQRRGRYRVTGGEMVKLRNAADPPVSSEPMTGEDGEKVEAPETSSALARLRERRRRRRMVREQFFAAPSQSEEETNVRRTGRRKESNSVDTSDNKKVSEGKTELVSGLERSSPGRRREKLDSKEAKRSSESKVGETAVDGKLPSRNTSEHHNGLVRNGHVSSETKENKKNEKRRPSPKIGEIGKKFSEDCFSMRHSRESKPRYQTIASTEHTDIIASLLRNKERTSHDPEGLFPSVSELRAKFIGKEGSTPLRINRTSEERPRSICGETLSPTELKKYEIQFSLERKISTETVVASPKRNAPAMVQRVETTVVEKASVSVPSEPKCDEKGKQVKTMVEDTKNVSTVEPSVEAGRRPMSPEAESKKSRGSKKKRKRSIFGSDKDRTSKESAEEQGESSQHVKVSGLKAMFGRRASIPKNRPKALAAGLKSELVKKASEMTQRREDYDEKVKGEMQKNQKLPELHVLHSEGSAREGRKEAQKDEHKLTDGTTEQKERKSLKKASKTRKEKRTFKSSLRPFGLTKTKSESNLYQPRLDPVAVEIPLDDDRTQKITNKTKDLNGSSESIKVASPTESKKGGSSLLEEGLVEFFGVSKAGDSDRGPKLEITLDDLDLISGKSAQQLSSLAENKLKVKPRRSHAASANPIKSLQNRTDTEKPKAERKPLSNEGAVVRRRRKSKDPANLWRRHTMVDLSASAIAGLASTEDFTKVRLRKTAGPEEKEKNEHDGTKPIMLLHIKGRRSIQTRLIEPCKKALNSGDGFVLVTPTDVFAWIGKEANTVERAKVTEISSRVVAKHELNCKAKEVVYIEEKDALSHNPKFWKILNAESDAEIRGPDSLPRDEEYEKGLIKSNMVYKVHWTEPPHLIPVEEMCGCLPQFSILHTKEVFVFDFGSEVYVWNGQQSLSGKRKTVLALAKQLYDEPFKVNGMYDSVFPYGKTDTETENSKSRPTWTLFAQLHEKAETILFREKFLDWPDPTKIIKMKGHPSSGELLPPPPAVELKPCEPKLFHQPIPRLADQVLEGTNIGRGHGVKTVRVGDYCKEGNMVTTAKRTVWHINEYRHFELPSASIGHLYSGEGYVIRWEYFVLNDRIATDRRSRCRSTVAGRVRTAYFFWQGNDCSVNEKGAAAVMAVELDEEKGPQIRVVQGKEPPAFLNMFKGAMIIHRGKREHQGETTEKIQDAATIRLYVVRNEQPGETCLVQVTANSFSLRSRCSFVLLLCNEAHIYVWHGAKCSEDLRCGAKVAAKAIQDRKPEECNVANVSAITVAEIEEGSEPDEFWEALGGRKYYCTLADEPELSTFAPRLFQLSSTTGKFTTSEVLCPTRSENKISAFPFLQEDLYTAYAPALFLLDGHSEVYIWEGWKPKDDGTGSSKQRWDRDRQLAMETALNYAQTVDQRVAHRVFLVYAGLEPGSFKALFPYWNDRPDVTKIQKEEGKHTVDKFSVKELLLQFTKEFYTLKELQLIPQGVDPAKLETYLSDEEFQTLFAMTKEELHKLPGWKQVNLKKQVGLF